MDRIEDPIIRGMYEFQPKKLTDLFDCHDHCTRQNNVLYYHTYLQFLALFACGADTNSQDTRGEDSAKSGMSQDDTSRTS